MYVGKARKNLGFFKVNEYSCKPSKLKELCLMSPYVRFIFKKFFELVGVWQLFLMYVGKARKNLGFFKVNEYSCKPSKLKELCVMSPYVRFIFNFFELVGVWQLFNIALMYVGKGRKNLGFFQSE